MFSISVGSQTEWEHIVVGEGKVRRGVNVFSDDGSLGLHVSVAALLKSNMALRHTHTHVRRRLSQQILCTAAVVVAANAELFLLRVCFVQNLQKAAYQ